MQTEQIGDATLYLGDCLEILPNLESVDAVITDPPYAVPTLVAQTREVFRNVGDLSIAETAYRVHAKEWTRVIGDKGRIFVFCDGSSYPSFYRALYAQFNLALLIWDKGRIGMGREFRKTHELIIHGWKAKTPIFADGIGRPDIIKIAPLSSDARVHPAEKPIGIITELLIVSGQSILDPFMGSGTTGVACANLGRRFIGIEIEPTYFDIACKRIEQAYQQPRLFDDKEIKKASCI